MPNYIKPRIRKSFSDRTGLSTLNTTIQVDDFNSETRVYLQNQLLHFIDEHLRLNVYLDRDDFMLMIAEKAFNLEADSRIYYTKDQIFNIISGVFRNGKYYEILDLIEYFSDVISFKINYDDFEKEDYCIFFNGCFEKEFIGYRFVNGVIVQSIDEEANKSIENAASTDYDIINKHISKAVSLLSGRDKDPENSIKESVSAVEYLCNVLAGTHNFELSKAIAVMDKKKKLHPCMKSMIEKIYGFASDEEGIRHSTKDGITSVSFNDALFILVTCSAFINYALSFYNDD